MAKKVEKKIEKKVEKKIEKKVEKKEVEVGSSTDTLRTVMAGDIAMPYERK